METPDTPLKAVVRRAGGSKLVEESYDLLKKNDWDAPTLAVLDMEALLRVESHLTPGNATRLVMFAQDHVHATSEAAVAVGPPHAASVAVAVAPPQAASAPDRTANEALAAKKKELQAPDTPLKAVVRRAGGSQLVEESYDLLKKSRWDVAALARVDMLALLQVESHLTPGNAARLVMFAQDRVAREENLRKAKEMLHRLESSNPDDAVIESVAAKLEKVQWDLKREIRNAFFGKRSKLMFGDAIGLVMDARQPANAATVAVAPPNAASVAVAPPHAALAPATANEALAAKKKKIKSLLRRQTILANLSTAAINESSFSDPEWEELEALLKRKKILNDLSRATVKNLLGVEIFYLESLGGNDIRKDSPDSIVVAFLEWSLKLPEDDPEYLPSKMHGRLASLKTLLELQLRFHDQVSQFAKNMLDEAMWNFREQENNLKDLKCRYKYDDSNSDDDRKPEATGTTASNDDSTGGRNTPSHKRPRISLD